jgi:CheY-like chemotaxis protein
VLALDQMSRSAERVASGGGADVTRRTVLVVAADDVARAILVDLLRGQPDLAAAGATSVEEALWFLRGIRVHLVLLDLRADDRDGVDPIARVRGDRAAWGVPLVALTPVPWSGSEQAARLAGCAAVLADPADPDVLVEAVRAVLNEPMMRR